MELVFWAAAALIAYVYAGYPLLLVIVRIFVRARTPGPAGDRPFVTLIVSAHNELDVIGEKLANSLTLDYPSDRLEVLVVSDASSDGTDAIVTGFGDPRVRLLRMSERGGKTLGLNAAVCEARGEILVFSDANAMYARDALVELTRHFASAEVGAVIGESTYDDADNASDRSESLYWRYEVAIKRLESAVGSVVGGDGAIYAVRTRLYRPMPADALSDFVNPLQIVLGGHRCVYEPGARSVEKAAGEFGREFRRKVRIVNRAWRAMRSLRGLLNPLRFGLFSVQLMSHKVLRWLVPAFLAVLLAASVALAGQGPWFAAALALQVLFYLLALTGHLLRKRGRVPGYVSVPYYFCLVNLASAIGIVEAYQGKTYTTWATARTTNR